MKIKSGFSLRNVCGENVIIAEGLENLDFSKMIHLNESAAYLWEKVQNKDFTAEELASLLQEEYEVDAATALHDATALLDAWVKDGVVE